MVESYETLIARVLKIPASLVTDELGYQSIPEWDSLNHVELMLALEETHGREIDGDLVMKLSTVASIREFTEQQMEARKSQSAVINQRLAEIDSEVTEQLGVRADVDPATIEQRSAKATEETASVRRGLNGVLLDWTRTTYMDGQTGKLLYRGYTIRDLAEHSTFEETSYLLLYGQLPTSDDLAAFDAKLRDARSIPQPVLEIIRHMKDAHPMDVLRTAVSILAAFDPQRYEESAASIIEKGIRVIAQLPTIVTAHDAIRNGREVIAPCRELSHAANFLYMLKGERPTELATRLMDKDLIVHADHGSNASAFTARVVTGTRADLHSAITAAIAAFSGPLHGGAAENVMKMIREIGHVEGAAEYVRKKRENNEPVMGFGHRVYRTEDPRVPHLREGARLLSEEMQEPKWFAILEAVVEAMRPYSRHGVHVNVDFYAGAAYNLLAIPQDLFVSVFVLGRISGWVAQVLEQFEHNILIRPLLQYVGEQERPYAPVGSREPSSSPMDDETRATGVGPYEGASAGGRG